MALFNRRRIGDRGRQVKLHLLPVNFLMLFSPFFHIKLYFNILLIHGCNFQVQLCSKKKIHSPCVHHGQSTAVIGERSWGRWEGVGDARRRFFASPELKAVARLGRQGGWPTHALDVAQSLRRTAMVPPWSTDGGRLRFACGSFCDGGESR